MDDQPQFLTIEELATKSRLSVSTLQRLKDAGKIQYYQPAGKGGRLLFPADAIERAAQRISGLQADSRDEKVQRLPGPRPAWTRNKNDINTDQICHVNQTINQSPANSSSGDS